MTRTAGTVVTLRRSNSGTLATLSRAEDKPFESSAQNFEDVVLWRVLHGVERGCYVDVGAFDPVVDSISWSFYEQGWQGVLIEPVPSLAAAIRRRRPNDITIEAAAGARRGTASLFVTASIGNSTLVPDVADRVAATGVEFSEIVVSVAPLNDLLEDAGLDARTIHFCTIDVEGSESDVLAGFDLARWRPWILVIEATEPNSPRASHELWEKHVLEAGYQFCLFDGVNRFYVHPDKADDFAEQLSYPACAFDDAFHRAVLDARRAAELEREKVALTDRANEAVAEREELEREKVALTDRANEAVAEREELEREKVALTDRANEAVAQLSAMQRSVSWRVTRPLRAVRDAQIRLARRPSSVTEPAPERDLEPASARRVVQARDLEPAFARRVIQAAATLRPETEVGPYTDVDEALAALEEALTSSTAPTQAKAWLSLVAVHGSFPGERSVDRVARLLRMDGPDGVRKELLRRFAHGVEQGQASTAHLDIRINRVIVDVSHTAATPDLHTGIQRVVRETVARWLESGRPMDLIRFNLSPPAAQLLSSEDCKRFMDWRSYIAGSATTMPHRAPREGTGNTVVPWHCRLVVPELPFEKERTAAYRGLGAAKVLRSLSMVGYDVIPIIASEKVVPQMTTDFAGYLSVLKHADRVSAISRTSMDSFNAVAIMAAAEGLRAPTVEAHELPTEVPELDSAMIEAARAGLGVGAGPVVLVVGSHEPRKNHLAVLEAAERLWARPDRAFELLFLGWSGWLGEEFDELVEKLVSTGRPIVVRKRCSEEELWAAYRLARFTVFPSLLEGYGLPIAESLASGTPVITSSYGSMAEVAEQGGCLLVDPRDVNELERAMALLLDDDEVLGRPTMPSA
jgi:FkbM family methyltransferase